MTDMIGYICGCSPFIDGKVYNISVLVKSRYCHLLEAIVLPCILYRPDYPAGTPGVLIVSTASYGRSKEHQQHSIKTEKRRSNVVAERIRLTNDFAVQHDM